jgi:hypothetical protein
VEALAAIILLKSVTASSTAVVLEMATVALTTKPVSIVEFRVEILILSDVSQRAMSRAENVASVK